MLGSKQSVWAVRNGLFSALECADKFEKRRKGDPFPNCLCKYRKNGICRRATRCMQLDDSLLGLKQGVWVVRNGLFSALECTDKFEMLRNRFSPNCLRKYRKTKFAVGQPGVCSWMTHCLARNRVFGQCEIGCFQPLSVQLDDSLLGSKQGVWTVQNGLFSALECGDKFEKGGLFPHLLSDTGKTEFVVGQPGVCSRMALCLV